MRAKELTMSSVFNAADASRVITAVTESGMPPAYVETMRSTMDAYLAVLGKAVASGTTEDLAVELYCEANPDSDDTKMLLKGAEAQAAIKAKIDELNASINELKAKSKDVKETVAGIHKKAVEQYGEAAKATRSTLTANVGTELRDSANKVSAMLSMVGVDTSDIVIPSTISQATSGKAGKAGKSGGAPRVRLSAASVNGEDVTPAPGKDNPTAQDIANLIESTPGDVTKAILDASDGNREFADLEVTIGKHTLVVTSR